MATSLYLFQGSNIGVGGVTFDAIDIPEMMYLLTKKFFGIPNTIPDMLYSSEKKPNIEDAIPNSFPFIHQTKIYSQIVPLSNPMSILTIFQPETTTLDVSWSNYNFSNFYRIPMCNDNLSKRYVSKTHPYICYYSNLLLTNLPNPVDDYTQTFYTNYFPTYVHPLLVNSISRRHDVTYFSKISQNNGTVISDTNGYPLIDNDAGTLVFYDSNRIGSQQVGPNNLPRVSFYRYEGLFGEASILQGQDL
jgi:hypothetical protein